MALSETKNWCDLLMLHINTQYCRSGKGRGGRGMLANLNIQLNADESPLGTKNYRISVEGVVLEEDKSFLHLAYDYGLAGRLGLRAYLSTPGRNKVGFMLVPSVSSAAPACMGGLRGLIERNTMRYYLAKWVGKTARPVIRAGIDEGTGVAVV